MNIDKVDLDDSEKELKTRESNRIEVRQSQSTYLSSLLSCKHLRTFFEISPFDKSLFAPYGLILGQLQIVLNLNNPKLMPVQMNFMWQCALRHFFLDTQLT